MLHRIGLAEYMIKDLLPDGAVRGAVWEEDGVPASHSGLQAPQSPERGGQTASRQSQARPKHSHHPGPCQGQGGSDVTADTVSPLATHERELLSAICFCIVVYKGRRALAVATARCCCSLMPGRRLCRLSGRRGKRSESGLPTNLRGSRCVICNRIVPCFTL